MKASTLLRLAIWLTAPVACELVAYGIQTRQGVTHTAPTVEFPSVVDLGPQEVGTIAFGEFEVRNLGNTEVKITDIRTDCQCTGLRKDGSDVETFALTPHETARLTVKVRVTGIVGRELVTNIRFETDDRSPPKGTSGSLSL